MRKIIKPFNQLGNPCFACSENNPVGLKMDFYEEGDEVVSEWEPRPEFQGYINVLHGGIQTTLLDELASWTVYVKAGTAGVTSSIDIRFLKPVFVNKGKLRLQARLTGRDEREAVIRAEIVSHRNQVCTEAEIRYFLFPEKLAREKYFYPGREAFFESLKE